MTSQLPQRFSLRYGTRHPWLVSWPRAAVYLVWRGLVAGLRPALFLASLSVAVVAAVLAAQGVPQIAAPPLSLTERVDAALHDAIPAGADRHSVWLRRIDQSLQTPDRRMPDILQTRSLAEAYVVLRGRDALGLELLSDGRHHRHLEAELRSLSAWQRENRLNEAIGERLSRAAEQGVFPDALIFAPAGVRARLNRNQRLYGPTLSEAEAWFVEPDGRALALDAFPGSGPQSTRVYGDIRGIVVQACAYAARSQRAMGQCRVGFLPKPAGDDVMAGLALAVAGASPERRAGARLAKAAWAAGRLDRDFAMALAFGTDVELGQAATLASTASLRADAGQVWTQPVRFEAAARDAAAEAARVANMDQRWRGRVFDALAALRREVGGLTALRLLDTVQTVDDAELLVRLSEASGPKMLALRELTGPEMLAELGSEDPYANRRMTLSRLSTETRTLAAISITAALVALSLLIATLLKGWNRSRGGPAGAFERVDRAFSRLILGRNV